MRLSLLLLTMGFLIGCSRDTGSQGVKNQGLPRPEQPLSETANTEGHPAQGQMEMKLDSGKWMKGPAIGGPDQKPQPIKLQSGKEIKVLAAGKLHLAQGNPGWIVHYETDLNIDDVLALQGEAEEIWPLIEKDIGKEGFPFVVLSAHEPRKPNSIGVSHNRGYNFVFERDGAGKWILTNKKTKNKSGKPKSPEEKPADPSDN
jgi:hypothetical protein